MRRRLGHWFTEPRSESGIVLAMASANAQLAPESATGSGAAALQSARDSLNDVILGKREQIDLALTALIAGGHVLVEDLPGVGKTTLAQSLAQVSGLDFRRIQFTADMLPADVTGVSVYDSSAGRFDFHPGPLFSQVVLADEINRGTPKTQSALLEAMAERQVTVDGNTMSLPRPFFVVATQNPVDLAGTFPLPDSQLDRFMLRLQLGYPDAASERQLLTGEDPRRRIGQLTASLSAAEILRLRDRSRAVHVGEPVTEYVLRLVTGTREHPDIAVGLSPRAGIALLAAARARALLAGRQHARPGDVQDVFAAVAAHRLQPAQGSSASQSALADEVREQTPIP